MTYDEVMAQLKALANPQNTEGMARFGINTATAYGISVTTLRKFAKPLGKDHRLAQRLWKSGVHEARILASIIADPALVSEKQMEAWVRDFDSWDVCDQCCGNLFDKTPWAFQKAAEWSRRDEEFVRRAGFALMAALAWHDKAAKDEAFVAFMPLIKAMATDERNFVRKAVNWALRQIGKRNARLNKVAIQTARAIERMDSKAARWIAKDALRELTSEARQKKVKGVK